MSIPVRSALDLGLNQLLSAVAENLTADPGTATEGRVVMRSDTHTLKVGANGAWVSFLVSTTRLDQLASPTGPVALNGQKITGLADGVANTDAATVQQVNNAIAGIDFKGSVKAASTANLTLSGTQTVDGIALIAGDRVLAKNQTAPETNGIYVVAAGAWARATDFDAWTEIPGSIVTVEQGTANGDKAWLATADQGGTLNTTAITFAAFGTAGGAGTVVKFSADVTGDGSTTNFAVTHNLGTTDVQVQAWEASTGALVIVDVVKTNSNAVSVNFGIAPANAKVYRVVVMG